jgi:hypothetical protein
MTNHPCFTPRKLRIRSTDTAAAALQDDEFPVDVMIQVNASASQVKGTPSARLDQLQPGFLTGVAFDRIADPSEMDFHQLY